MIFIINKRETIKGRRTENKQEKTNRFRPVKSPVSGILAVGRDMNIRPVKLSVKNMIFSDRLNTVTTMVPRTEQMKYFYNKNQRDALVLKFIC
jgi:hypothetical protein